MLPTYQAILVGTQLEWVKDQPADLEPGQQRLVLVTVLEATTNAAPPDQGQRMAAILAELSKLPPNEALADPLAWEREVREDRVLHGREE